MGGKTSIKVPTEIEPWNGAKFSTYMQLKLSFIARSRAWITALILSALLLGCQSQGRTMSPSESQRVATEVRSAFDALVVVSKTLDTEAYLSLFSEDGFSAMLDGSATLSFAEFERFYRQQVPQIEEIISLDFPVVEIRPINLQTALLINEYTETLRLRSGEIFESSGGGSQLWVKRNDKWLLQHIAGGAKH
jgi:hypothetical protein